jgi:hypothetical protein
MLEECRHLSSPRTLVGCSLPGSMAGGRGLGSCRPAAPGRESPAAGGGGRLRAAVALVRRRATAVPAPGALHDQLHSIAMEVGPPLI